MLPKQKDHLEVIHYLATAFLLLLFPSLCSGVIFCHRPTNESEIRQRLFAESPPPPGDAADHHHHHHGNSVDYSPSARFVYPYGTRIQLMVYPLGLWELSEQTDIASLLFYVRIKWRDPSKRWNNLTSHECLMISTDTPVWKPMIKFVDDRSMLISSRVIYEPEVMHLLSDGSFYYANMFQVYIALVDLVQVNKQVRQIVRFDTAQFPFDQVRLEVMCNVDNVYSTDLDYVPRHRSSMNRPLQLTPDWELVTDQCQKDNTNATQCLIVVARNAQFYIVNFCVPTLATTTLAVFGIHSAVQVNSRSSKYQMGLMALISLSTVSFSFVGSLPRSGHVSRLHVFYFGMVGAIFSSCLISWTILTIENQPKKWSKVHRPRYQTTTNCRHPHQSQSHQPQKNTRRSVEPEGGEEEDGDGDGRRAIIEERQERQQRRQCCNNNNNGTGGVLTAAEYDNNGVRSPRPRPPPPTMESAATSLEEESSDPYCPSITDVNPPQECIGGPGSESLILQDLIIKNRTTIIEKGNTSRSRKKDTTTDSTIWEWLRTNSKKCRRWTPSRDFLRLMDTVSVVLHILALTNLTLWFMSAPQQQQQQQQQQKTSDTFDE